jgi:hypothetical protein
MPRPAVARRLTCATAAAAAVLLGACACIPSPPPDPTSSAEPTTSARASAEVVPDPDVPTDVVNEPALRELVSIAVCEAEPGGWRASGPVSNPGDEDLELTVTVFFTSPGGTVLGTGETKVDVAAGADETWEVTAELTPTDPTSCVLRGVG